MSMTGMSGSTELRQEKNSEINRIPLAKQVRSALEHYFHDLDGQDPSDLYRMVLNEIEKPLLEIVIQPVLIGFCPEIRTPASGWRFLSYP